MGWAEKKLSAPRPRCPYRRQDARGPRASAALGSTTFNQWVSGSSPGSPTTQSPETHATKSASEKAAFAAISRARWSPISGLCAEISSSGPFRRVRLRRQKSRSKLDVARKCGRRRGGRYVDRTRIVCGPAHHIVRRHFDGHVRKGTKARHGVLLIPSRLWSRDLLHEAIAIVDWRDRVPKAAAIPE